jgi:phosphatidylinositol 4-kinase A
MVELMGGRYSQGYELFQHLAVKGFLAIRPYADQLVSTVQLMLGTGLPSFKGEQTIKRLRDRFTLGSNERQAAEWMVGIVRNAHENVRSIVYDEFQRVGHCRCSLRHMLTISAASEWYVPQMQQAC